MAASTTSDAATGGSTTSQPTSTDASTTDGTAASPTTGEVGSGVKEDCDASSAARAQVNMLICGCEVENGSFLDVESCLTFLDEGPAQQADLACVCEQLATDPGNANGEACRRGKWEAWLACITPLQCSQSAAFGECFDAFVSGESCSETSKQSDVQVELQCHGAKPFLCASGETILEDWTCDGSKDCMDGSDEQNC